MRNVFFRHIAVSVRNIVRSVLGIVPAGVVVVVRVVIITMILQGTPMVHFVKRLYDDVAKPDANIGAAHVHQAETGEGFIAMNAHLNIEEKSQKSFDKKP